MKGAYYKVSGYTGATVKGYTANDGTYPYNGDNCSCYGLWYIYNNYLTPVVGNIVNIPQLIVTTINITSDVSTKHDITDIPTYEIDKLEELSGKCYYLKTDPTRMRFGYIAQDMETVFPTLVGNYTEAGNKTIKTIDYVGLIPLMIEKINQMDRKIDNLIP